MFRKSDKRMPTPSVLNDAAHLTSKIRHNSAIMHLILSGGLVLLSGLYVLLLPLARSRAATLWL